MHYKVLTAIKQENIQQLEAFADVKAELEKQGIPVSTSLLGDYFYAVFEGWKTPDTFWDLIQQGFSCCKA